MEDPNIGSAKLSLFKGIKTPKLIYSTQSEYNGKINVYETGKTRKIQVGNIDQSLNWDAPNAGRLVWGKIVEILKQNVPGLRSLLFFGLGGGTTQHLVSQAFPGIHITSIEIDPAMVEIAKKYFDIDRIPNHDIITGDACGVVMEPRNYGIGKRSFQCAVVDIYVGDKYPDLGKAGNFVGAVKEMVAPGSLVIFNRIYTKNHQEDVNNFVKFIEGFFNDVQTYVVAGYTNSDNILIYGRS
ncbi:hypothetical protein ACFL13_01125 [Patescibacteria group bacterium]